MYPWQKLWCFNGIKRKAKLSSPFHPSFLGFIYILYGQYLQRLFGHSFLDTLLVVQPGPLHACPGQYAGQNCRSCCYFCGTQLVYLYGHTSTHHGELTKNKRKGELQRRSFLPPPTIFQDRNIFFVVFFHKK